MTIDAELVDSFLEEASGYLKCIREELAPALAGQQLSARNLQRLQEAVHSLKGVSGLLGFTHLHQLVARLEGALHQLASATTGRVGIAPEIASAAVQSIERMIENIASGEPDANEEILLEFESGLEIFSAVSSRTGAQGVTGSGLAQPEDLAEALREEIGVFSQSLHDAFAAARQDTRPAPRQRAAAREEENARALSATAAMAGRPDLSDIFEALADLLRDMAAGRLAPDDAALDLAVRLSDGAMRLASYRLEDPEAAPLAQSLLTSVYDRRRLDAADGAATSHEEEAMLAELREVFAEEATEHLAAARRAIATLEQQPEDTEALGALFRATHTLKGAAGTVGLDAVMEIAHGLEDLFAGLRARKGPVEPAALDVARSGLSKIERLLAGTPSEGAAAPEEAQRDIETRRPAGRSVRVSLERLDALLLEAGDLLATKARLEEASGRMRELLHLVARRARALSSRIDDFATRHAYTHPLPVRSRREGIMTSAVAEDWSGLEFDRYDDLNVLSREVAELDFQLQEALSGLSRLADALGDDVEEIDRHTQRLQQGLTRARFVPITDLFDRFVRPAKEWARAEGKEVEVVVEEATAELDRAVVDAVSEPLVHLVRNAVTHGIESPEERRRQGKPPIGRITLRAWQLGRDVVVEVADDGRGLDPPALREVAVARGVLSREEAERMPDAQIVEVIFAPGFSTRDSADALAGRGVGLDVVATSVARLGGVLSVSHRPRQGTTFSARLPATQVILEVLTVLCGGQRFALPHAAVRETLLVDRREAASALDGGRIYWRGEPLRVLSLAALTGAPQAHHARRVPAVVVGHGERNCALLVDRLVGREEGIVKPLGPLLEPLGLYAGAVVGGEGRVRLVLDAAWLLTASMGRPRPRRPLGPGESQRPRILLVDDSLSVRTHLSRILRSNGWEVRVAADGRAALEQALTNSFDLVLTDLEMPRMHGFDLIERLRAEPRYAGIPIVVLSSRAGRKHRERARQLGAADFLAKPVNRDVLLARLRAQLSHSRSK